MESAGLSSPASHRDSPSGRRRRLPIRRQLVVAYVVLGLARIIVMGLSEEMAPSVGLLDIAIAVSLAVGLWRGARPAWYVAVALDGLVLVLLLWSLTVPWGSGQTALVMLVALRLAVLLQRPLRLRSS